MAYVLRTSWCNPCRTDVLVGSTYRRATGDCRREQAEIEESEMKGERETERIVESSVRSLLGHQAAVLDAHDGLAVG